MLSNHQMDLSRADRLCFSGYYLQAKPVLEPYAQPRLSACTAIPSKQVFADSSSVHPWSGFCLIQPISPEPAEVTVILRYPAADGMRDA